MSSYGLLDTGFVDKPLEAIIEDIETAERSLIDPGLDTSTSSPIGQQNGIFAGALREIWELLQAIVSSWNPDTSSDVYLAALAALTGTTRRAATKSVVTGRLNIDAGRTVPAGSVASVVGNPHARFATLVDVTNSGGTAADFDVTMEAETAGAVIANSGTLTEIETPVVGWNSITNPADATIGLDEETDGELRERREDELRSTGAAALDAIRADVLSVAGVTAVAIFENVTLVTDGDGVPGKAFETVVLGGADQDIIDQIWESKPAGIEAHGTTSGTAIDAVGNPHTIKFTRPIEVDIYINVAVTTNTDPNAGPVYPADGDTQIKTAIAVWAQENLSIGDDLYFLRLYEFIFGIDGVVDVTALELDTSPNPTVGQNIFIGTRELANVDTSNIDVTSS